MLPQAALFIPGNMAVTAKRLQECQSYKTSTSYSGHTGGFASNGSTVVINEYTQRKGDHYPSGGQGFSSSARFLAKISARSPQKIFIFIT